MTEAPVKDLEKKISQSHRNIRRTRIMYLSLCTFIFLLAFSWFRQPRGFIISSWKIIFFYWLFLSLLVGGIYLFLGMQLANAALYYVFLIPLQIIIVLFSANFGLKYQGRRMKLFMSFGMLALLFFTGFYLLTYFYYVHWLIIFAF